MTTTTTLLDEVRRAAVALRTARKDENGDFWPITDAKSDLRRALVDAGHPRSADFFDGRARDLARAALAWANEQEATR